LDACHAEEFLTGGGGDEACTARGGDEPNADGAALARDFAGHGVGGSALPSPVTAADGDYVELGDGDGTANGGGYF